MQNCFFWPESLKQDGRLLCQREKTGSDTSCLYQRLMDLNCPKPGLPYFASRIPMAKLGCPTSGSSLPKGRNTGHWARVLPNVTTFAFGFSGPQLPQCLQAECSPHFKDKRSLQQLIDVSRMEGLDPSVWGWELHHPDAPVPCFFYHHYFDLRSCFRVCCCLWCGSVCFPGYSSACWNRAVDAHPPLSGYHERSRIPLEG